MSNKHYRNKSADKVQTCANEYYWSSDGDPATIVQDMLADLRHYCDRHDLDFESRNQAAHQYYLDELNEDKLMEGNDNE